MPPRKATKAEPSFKWVKFRDLKVGDCVFHSGIVARISEPYVSVNIVSGLGTEVVLISTRYPTPMVIKSTYGADEPVKRYAKH